MIKNITITLLLGLVLLQPLRGQNLSAAVDKMIFDAEIMQQQLEEFADMTLELSKLHDKRVTKILDKHIPKISALAEKALK